MIESNVIDLTPDVASNILSMNNNNRPLSKATVAKYVSAMKRGEWALNGQPIIIFSDGTLGDGQHRCAAVVKSGISIKTAIVYGIDKESFPTIDGGKPRNNADALAIRGEKHYVMLSSAARSALFESLQGREKNEITTSQIIDTIEKHQHVRFWVQKMVGNKLMRKFVPASFCGVLALASERYGIEKIEPFFEQVASGLNVSVDSPAYVLRERLIGQTNSKKISAQTQRAFMVKALNAHILGKRMSILRFYEGVEAMPKVL